jgi:hypothetical protein
MSFLKKKTFECYESTSTGLTLFLFILALETGKKQSFDTECGRTSLLLDETVSDLHILFLKSYLFQFPINPS